ncbi:hypothetical protein HDA32_000425 [Spinactinospora alkalitolerans]|uniref:Uncharacterized protein n=1 Tax=Spinactinospora alkalitolerans TaxID=687207 RepID=A0A852TNX4_9ACTN|nr:hypothetical protein [Spinactinospora alkalitolerans]
MFGDGMVCGRGAGGRRGRDGLGLLVGWRGGLGSGFQAGGEGRSGVRGGVSGGRRVWGRFGGRFGRGVTGAAPGVWSGPIGGGGGAPPGLRAWSETRAWRAGPPGPARAQRDCCRERRQASPERCRCPIRPPKSGKTGIAPRALDRSGDFVPHPGSLLTRSGSRPCLPPRETDKSVHIHPTGCVYARITPHKALLSAALARPRPFRTAETSGKNRHPRQTQHPTHHPEPPPGPRRPPAPRPQTTPSPDQQTQPTPPSPPA